MLGAGLQNYQTVQVNNNKIYNDLVQDLSSKGQVSSSLYQNIFGSSPPKIISPVGTSTTNIYQGQVVANMQQFTSGMDNPNVGFGVFTLLGSVSGSNLSKVGASNADPLINPYTVVQMAIPITNTAGTQVAVYDGLPNVQMGQPQLPSGYNPNIYFVGTYYVAFQIQSEVLDQFAITQLKNSYNLDPIIRALNNHRSYMAQVMTIYRLRILMQSSPIETRSGGATIMGGAVPNSIGMINDPIVINNTLYPTIGAASIAGALGTATTSMNINNVLSGIYYLKQVNVKAHQSIQSAQLPTAILTMSYSQSIAMLNSANNTVQFQYIQQGQQQAQQYGIYPASNTSAFGKGGNGESLFEFQNDNYAQELPAIFSAPNVLMEVLPDYIMAQAGWIGTGTTGQTTYLTYLWSPRAWFIKQIDLQGQDLVYPNKVQTNVVLPQFISLMRVPFCEYWLYKNLPQNRSMTAPNAEVFSAFGCVVARIIQAGGGVAMENSSDTNSITAQTMIQTPVEFNIQSNPNFLPSGGNNLGVSPFSVSPIIQTNKNNYIEQFNKEASVGVFEKGSTVAKLNTIVTLTNGKTMTNGEFQLQRANEQATEAANSMQAHMNQLAKQEEAAINRRALEALNLSKQAQIAQAQILTNATSANAAQVTDIQAQQANITAQEATLNSIKSQVQAAPNQSAKKSIIETNSSAINQSLESIKSSQEAILEDDAIIIKNNN